MARTRLTFRQRGLVALVVTIAAIAACSHDAAGPVTLASEGGHQGPDSGGTSTGGGTFVPASSITLTIHVATAAAGSDTLSSATPVAGAVVTIHSMVTTPNPNAAGADTLVETATPVASATSNAAGVVTFASLPSARYRIDVTAPSGSALTDVWTVITPPFPAQIALTMVLRPR